MTLVSPADLIGIDPVPRAVAAFNVILIEQLEAFIHAAAATNSHLIVQLSQNAVRYRGALEPIASAMLAAADNAPGLVAVQLDHADDRTLIQEAVRLGFTSVMYDCSKLDYEANVATTSSIAAELHRSGVWVEAELGEIGGKDGVHSPTARTHPEEAASFVSATGIDGLAVAVGSSHAMTEQSARLDVGLIAQLAEYVDVPLVLHGSSGVSDSLLGAAVRAGIRKVNFGTRFNKVFTTCIRHQLAESPAVVDPRTYMASARSAVESDARQILTQLRVL